MSGIVGIIHLNGAPIDRSLLERMTDDLTFRGNDARQVWIDGNIGFGHTLLRTTWEAEYEHQPFTLDLQVWIVADARIDDRDTLAAKLGLAPLPSPPFTSESQVITDVELILRAYLHWGDDCVQHLLGDFAVAIWDDRQQRLFCVRDRFGVKPFYYSQVSNCLLMSNTLNCLRQHPQVSSKLNDRTIGDLLLFDLNYNPETTTFADIQRLPPAHLLTWSSARGLQTSKYWTLPMPDLIRYQHPQDYLDRFQELMGQAVADRLRTSKVASFFSGGLDSTTITATAVAVAKQRAWPIDFQALTIVSDRLIPDRERYYAGLAAHSLGIPIDYQVADDYQLYQGWENPQFPIPEPANNPLLILHWERFQRVADRSRVALSGYGGDEALTPTTVVEMLQTMSILDVGLDVSRSYLGFGIQPHWGSGLLGLFRQWRQPAPPDRLNYPSWLNPDFARSLELAQRWAEIRQQPQPSIDSPRSPAYQRNNPLFWTPLLELNDPGCSGVGVEVRYPFIDLRLLNYLLALPPAPWCVNKMLLRSAMKQILPDEVRLRPKTPLMGEPLSARGLQSIDRASVDRMLPAIESYVSIDRLFSVSNPPRIWDCWEQLMPISFAYWLDRDRR